MTIPTLRPYQTDSIDAVTNAWLDDIQRPALELATGLGKTVIVAEIMSRAFRGGRHPLLLVHRDELVQQSVNKLLAVDPSLLIGVIKGDRHETHADIVVASVQTLHRRLGVGRKGVAPDRFNLIVTDECHHASAATYVKIYNHFGGLAKDSGTLMLGVTATLARGDGIPLGHIWDKVVYEYGALEGIENGYLVPPRAFRARIDGLDLARVKTQRGDWSAGDLGTKMVRAGDRIVEAIQAYGLDDYGHCRRGIVFAPTIECAQMWAEDFNAAGFVSRVVVGETPIMQRQAVYRGVHAGVIDLIVSVMCLTEGFDLPAVELAVIGRPTRMVPLYVQMLGRVLRPSPETGKRDAVVLDVCGVMNEGLGVSMQDLGIPPGCSCHCDCSWAYICVRACPCPAALEGQTKIHGDECLHTCPTNSDGGGGGEGPPQELDIDGRPIEITEVDVFADVRKRLTKRKPHPWLVTKGGIPFLAKNGGSKLETVFLFAEADDTWTVGVHTGGRAVRIAEHLAYVEAVDTAQKRWGPKVPPLAGAITNGQISVLAGNRVEYRDDMSKQEASDLISVLFTSRDLD